MPPTRPNQASRPRGRIHPLLRSVADEIRALLVRLLAYAGILAGVVLIGMELASGGGAALADFADYISKTKTYETSARTEATLGETSTGTPASDQAPTTEAPPDRAAGLQTPPATPAAPPPRDRMRRQRLLEPAKSPAGASCTELRRDQGVTKTDRGRCHTAASADWVTANGAPNLRGRI